MKAMAQTAKIGVVVVLVIAVSIRHYSTVHGKLAAHIPHRELYFIPIILASFWFGLRFGLITSLVVSLVYAPHVFAHENLRSNLLPVSFQIAVFNLVALVLGWLVERRRRQQSESLRVEKLAVLGRTAMAGGYEMKDHLNAMKRMFIHFPDSRFFAACSGEVHLGLFAWRRQGFTKEFTDQAKNLGAGPIQRSDDFFD